MKATVLRTSIILAGLFVFSGFGQPAKAAEKFEMVVTGKSPYPLVDRKDLSPVITDNFVLVPRPTKCDPKRVYRVKFRAKVLN